MIQKTIARRYAAALLDHAERAGAVEEIERQILEAAALWKASPELRRAALHPGIPLAQRRAMVRRAFGERFHPLVADFLELLLRRRRIGLLPDAAEAFDRLADRSRGVVKVRVRTFRPLAAHHRDALTQVLSRRLARKVELREEVDPALLGGIAVQIGDNVTDATVAGRLKRLWELLEESAAGARRPVFS